MFNANLLFILLLIVVLMPLIISLIPNVKNIRLGASKNGYGVIIEKYPTAKKRKKRKYTPHEN